MTHPRRNIKRCPDCQREMDEIQTPEERGFTIGRFRFLVRWWVVVKYECPDCEAEKQEARLEQHMRGAFAHAHDEGFEEGVRYQRNRMP